VWRLDLEGDREADRLGCLYRRGSAGCQHLACHWYPGVREQALDLVFGNRRTSGRPGSGSGTKGRGCSERGKRPINAMRPDLRKGAEDTCTSNGARERDDVHLPQPRAGLLNGVRVAIEQYRLRALGAQSLQMRLVVVDGLRPVVGSNEHERVDAWV